jgi:chromosome segregation ATPase
MPIDSKTDDAWAQKAMVDLVKDCGILRELQTRTDEQLKDLVIKASTLHTSVTKLTDKFRSYSNAIREIQAFVNTLEQKVNTVCTEVEVLKKQIEDIDGDRQDCPKKFSVIAVKIEKLSKEIALLKAENENQQKINRELSERVEVLQTKIDAIQKSKDVICTILGFFKSTWGALIVVAAGCITLWELFSKFVK